MGGIFISYRRRGSHAVSVGALADRLRHYFGSDLVFYDTQLTPGTRYPEELRDRLRGSDVVLAVVHDGWTDEFNSPRAKDWVHFEMVTALELGKPVVPVLLEHVDPPRRDELPGDLVKVADLQAARLRGAEFRADCDFLVRLLELHVAPDHDMPPERPAAPKRRRVGFRITAWTVGLSLFTPILFFNFAPLWEWFSLAAFGSAFILTVLSLLSMTFLPVITRLTRRWDDEAGKISLRETVRRQWIVPVLMILPLIFMLSRSRSGGDAWQEWEVWFFIVAGLCLLYFTHRVWRHYDAHDHQWPPPVSTEPAMFRRAVHRLHAKLTTEPDWRPPRPRAIQRQAESVLGSLAGVRQELETRASVSLSEWVRKGYSRETAGFLGWAGSIVITSGIAAVALAVSDSARLGSYLFIAVTVVAAVGSTLAKTAVDRRLDRREVRRWIDELTGWHARLAPLILDGGKDR